MALAYWTIHSFKVFLSSIWINLIDIQFSDLDIIHNIIIVAIVVRSIAAVIAEQRYPGIDREMYPSLENE